MVERRLICAIILTAINLLNYMDRFTVAGVLTDVIAFYDINDTWAGFLQTIFIVFFMVFAPVCGFLGDRFNRKWIIMAGEIVWVAAVLASSFIPSGHFWAFVLFRGVVGIGEASYSVIAPALIADMYAGKMRTRILMIFYFAIPVGSGLGYVISSGVTNLVKGEDTCHDCWQWGIRATPLIGLLTVIALIFGVQEPKRGQAESMTEEAEPIIEKEDDEEEQSSEEPINSRATVQHSRTTMVADLIYLAKNRTFVWSTVGYTAVVFVTGTLTWWSPAAIEEAMAWHQNVTNTSMLPNKDKISLTFGAITCLAGIFGVALGSIVSMIWKQGMCARRATPKVDPLISAIGSFLAAPLLFLTLHLFEWNQFLLSWIILFLTILCLCLNWAVNTDMVMSIIVPHRRSMASAVQILVSHAFGDASGPWIVGAISDEILNKPKSTPEEHFKALMLAFYLPNVLLVISGIAFVVATFTLPHTIGQLEEWRNRRKSPSQGTTGTARNETNTEDGSTQQPLSEQNYEGIPNEAFQ